MRINRVRDRISTRPRWLVPVLIALGLGVSAIVAVALSRSAPPTRKTLEIELRASAGDVAQLYWDDGRSGITNERSTRISLAPSGALQTLRFVLPRERLAALRFDPTDAPADVWIGRVRVFDSDGALVTTLNPASFVPGNEVASMKRVGDLTHIVVTPEGRDPFVMLPVDCLGGPAPWYGVTSVTPLSLTLACLGMAALLLAGAGVIGREVWIGASGSAGVGSGYQRWSVALWLAALLVAGFSAKLVLMRSSPLTVPFWEQWNVEAGSLYVPFNEGCLPWPRMIALHNEHRIAFTRLLALALLELNRGWDPRLQQVVNAALHALTAVLAASIFWLAAGRRYLGLFAFVSGLAVALPFGWENTLFGFQSAFYLVLLFSILGVGLTVRSPERSTARCSLGWTFTLCAILTSASGVLTAAAIGSVALLELAGSPGRWRGPALNLAAAGALLIVGLALASPPVPYHAHLQPATFDAYVSALGKNLSWPWLDEPGLAGLMWLPVSAMIITAVRRRLRTTDLERIAFGLSIWVLLHAGAIAYARGAQGHGPAARYTDFLSLGLLANAAALAALLDRTQKTVVARRVMMAGSAAWLVFAALGLDQSTDWRLTEQTGWRKYWAAHEANVRHFILTDDIATFTSKKPLWEVPHPDPPMLANAWLRHPYIRSILPAVIREPVRVQPREVTNNAFIQGGIYWRASADPERPGWGSFTDKGHAAVGRFESEPIAGCRTLGHLRFEVAGYLGHTGHSLVVKEFGSGREWEVRPSRVAMEGWTDAFVTCPRSPFIIVAVDQNVDSWFAFRAPVEIGWASEWAEVLIRQSRKLLLLALGLTIAALRWA